MDLDSLEVRAALSLRTHARISPAGLALYHSSLHPGGIKFQLYPHVAVINRAIVTALSRGATKKERRVIINTPPQVGKSSIVSRYGAPWIIGQNPNKRVLLCTYESAFAAGWGRKARDIFRDVVGPLRGLKIRDDSDSVSDWNLEGKEGGMNTAGVGGPISGKTANVLLIDDYLKNAEEAHSATVKDGHWAWWESTVYPRMPEDGVVVIVATRWAPDDLVGRILEEEGEEWTHVKMPALALVDEDWMDGVFVRRAGDSICPHMYSRQYYEDRRSKVSEYYWNAMYQQEPTPRAGRLFDVDKVIVVPTAPEIDREIRYWDLAGTKGGKGARTAGVRFGRVKGGMGWIVLDVICGRWEPTERDQRIVSVAKADGRGIKVVIEQEPGSGGKSQIVGIQRELDGYRVEGHLPKGDKATRAEPMATQVTIGRFYVVTAAWTDEVKKEFREFPGGPTKDIVDSCSGAHAYLALGPGRSSLYVG